MSTLTMRMAAAPLRRVSMQSTRRFIAATGCRRSLSSSTVARAVAGPSNLLASSSARHTAALTRVSSLGSVRTMFIQTEPTPNDDSLKFIPGVPVMSPTESNPGAPTSAEFLDTRAALASPLALRLMGIEGVTNVFYGPDFVTVSKSSEHPWSVLKPEIYSILMEHFTSGAPLFRSEADRDAAGPQDLRITDDDSEVVAMIKELLETRVRPAIMDDGGDIEYRGFDEDTGVVQLRLKGSCRGCASSAITLKGGIERMLMHYVPEVKSVEQVVDEEERIALSEFEKLEKKLEAKHKSTGLEQYASV